MKIPKVRTAKRYITDKDGIVRVRGYGLEVVFVEVGYHYLVEEREVPVENDQ